MTRALVLIGVLFISSCVMASPGEVDSLGCHHDAKEGYHCHRGLLAGKSFASKADAQRALKEAQDKAAKGGK